MTARGLNDPLLGIFDGAPGLTKAIRRVWPRAYRERCQVHTMRTILATLPRSAQAVMKRLVQQVCLAPSSEGALTRGRVLIARFKDRDPPAMECLEKDREECVTSVRFPKEHTTRGFVPRIAWNGWTGKAGAGHRGSLGSQRSARA